MKVTKKELFYNEFSDEWENKINKLETEKRLKVVFGEFLKRIGLNGKKFLEVGCGLGYFSEKAASLGAMRGDFDKVKKAGDKEESAENADPGYRVRAAMKNLRHIPKCTSPRQHITRRRAY